MAKWQNSNAGKIQVKRFNDAWRSLNWENGTYVELTGIIGKDERRSVLTAMSLGTGDNDTRADVAEAKERIGTKYAWTVTAGNASEIVKDIEAELVTLKQNRPVHDNRKTQDEENARNAEYIRARDEQKAKEETKARAFIAHYGNGEKVTIQPGQMAVVAKVCYDNSDHMTDYFDAHASLSQSFALLVLPKQAETERLARRGVAVSPLLSAIEFKWHTEKYSMGHGNYLESTGGFELPADLQGLREGYRSGPVTHAHWEITFTRAYSSPITLDTIAGYGSQPTPSGGQEPVTVSGVTVTENEEKDGIEIRFPSKPSADVLDSLKANGWRWSRFSSCWYTRRTDRARQFAESLKGTTPENTPPPTGGGAPVPVPSQTVTVAGRFRTWADALEPKIAELSRPMTQNPTPKRNCQYQRRLHDARNMERVQRALRALADGHDAGTLPASLAGLKTRDEIGDLVRKGIDGSKGGYYSCIECLDYARTTPDARALQSMIEANTPDREARERQRKHGELMAEIALVYLPGYFPTPATESTRVAELADIQPGMRILEPSAGSGNLVRAVFNQCEGVYVLAIERYSKLFEALQYAADGETKSVMETKHADFLELTPKELGLFDRIVMNPPFDMGADVKHIKHALTFLKPGGRLVAICANGSKQNEHLRPMVEANGGEWEPLAAGTFKEAGTNVSSVMLTLTTPSMVSAPPVQPSSLFPEQYN